MIGAPAQRFTGPVVQAGGVVYATNSRAVIALDANSKSQSGTTLWAKPKQFNGILGAPSVVGEKVWVVGDTPSNAASGFGA